MRAYLQQLDPGRGEAVYLGLGGNVGGRCVHLQRALFALSAHPEINVTAVSRLYESEYVGPGEQAPYLNACVEIRTFLSPRVLLWVLKGIEERLGRCPDTHLQPRPIDLDVLLYGDLVSDDPRLTLPHPRLRERAFVLLPLGDIAPARQLPDSKETVSAACARIRRTGGPWVRLKQEREWLPRAGAGGEVEWRAALAVHCR